MALQTKVNIKQAFGVAGEFYDDSPRRTATYTVGADSTFGTLAFLNSSGNVGPYVAATYTTLAGVFVRPKEAVLRNGLTASLTVAANDSVQVCSMGHVIVKSVSAITPMSPVYMCTVAGTGFAVGDIATASQTAGTWKLINGASFVSATTTTGDADSSSATTYFGVIELGAPISIAS